jgi:hypothetical protein
MIGDPAIGYDCFSERLGDCSAVFPSDSPSDVQAHPSAAAKKGCLSVTGRVRWRQERYRLEMSVGEYRRHSILWVAGATTDHPLPGLSVRQDPGRHACPPVSRGKLQDNL